MCVNLCTVLVFKNTECKKMHGMSNINNICCTSSVSTLAYHYTNPTVEKSQIFNLELKSVVEVQ